MYANTGDAQWAYLLSRAVCEAFNSLHMFCEYSNVFWLVCFGSAGSQAEQVNPALKNV